MNIPFVGPSYTSRSVNFDAQRTVNLYLEVDETQQGKSPIAMMGTPGLRLLVALPGSPVRGTWNASNGRFFAVAGSGLYEVSSTGSVTSRGTLSTSTGTVSMADNGNQLCIVDGANGYILNMTTNIFGKITTSGWRGSKTVSFQDGYFIFHEPNTGIFYICALYDGYNIDTLDFATAEASPDNIVGIISDHRELWLFGVTTTEVYFNSGNPDFPFERIPGAFIEHGCAAPYSIAKLDNSVFWLGSDDRGRGVIYRATGYQPQRISTHAVETAIQKYADLSDAVAYTYQQDGHSFYVINFTGADTTWVFDVATSSWHERAYTTAEGTLARHRANYHGMLAGSHIVGDYSNGNLYIYDLEYFTDNGNPITRLRDAQHISQNLKNLFWSSVQVDLETGIGATDSPEPQAMLQWSDDGGTSWSNEYWTSLGRIGNRKTRAIWRRLGRSRDRVLRLKITDPVKVVIIGAEAEVVQGTS